MKETHEGSGAVPVPEKAPRFGVIAPKRIETVGQLEGELKKREKTGTGKSELEWAIACLDPYTLHERLTRFKPGGRRFFFPDATEGERVYFAEWTGSVFLRGWATRNSPWYESDRVVLVLEGEEPTPINIPISE